MKETLSEVNALQGLRPAASTPMSELTLQILEQKRLRRSELAELSYPEKVRIVEKLRDAARRIANAARAQGLR